MDENQKQKISEAIKIMRDICDTYYFDETSCCSDCPLLRNCGNLIYDMDKIE